MIKIIKDFVTNLTGGTVHKEIDILAPYEHPYAVEIMEGTGANAEEATLDLLNKLRDNHDLAIVKELDFETNHIHYSATITIARKM